MNNHAINKMLKKADDALEKSGIMQAGKINEVYKGYVSGFGATVIQSGLLPTMAFYMATDKKENKGNAKYVIVAISQILGYATPENLFTECQQKFDTERAAFGSLRQDIVNASVALKIMMRTYQFFEPEKK